MKKLLLLTFIAFGINAKAQFNLEATYDSASVFKSNQLYMINLEVDGEKYVKIVRDSTDRAILLYNPNHTLYKKISCMSFPLPIDPMGYKLYNNVDILYISQHLFNLDNNIEFMYTYSFNAYTGIYDEFGSILFSVDSGFPGVRINVPQQHRPIYNTSQGTKMILSFMNGKAKVYGLQGILSTAIDITNESLLNSSNIVSNPYPNPTNNTTRIDYTFPSGVNDGEIVFYDLQGKEIKRFKVDKTFDHLLISTADIPAGTYFYQLQTNSQVSEGKKLVVIK